MKTQQLHLVQFGVALLLASGVAATTAAVEQSSEVFPYAVSFQLGEAKLAPGDSITIESLRGTPDTIRTGETVCVEGTYTLSSRNEAELALFVTTRQVTRSEIDPRQILRVKKGTGSFRLLKTMEVEGYPHLSFYPVPSGSSFGDIYFGHGDWVLNRKQLSGLDEPAGPRYTPAGGGSAEAPVTLSGPNRVLLEYLGNPVEAPAAMGAAYTQEGLRQAVQSAAARARISVWDIAIDDSEYPFLVGVFCNEADFEKLKAQLRQMEQYDYMGAVGSHSCYAFNITPWRAWPPEAQPRIPRRTMLRMQVFYDRLSARE